MTAEEYFNEAQKLFREGKKTQAVELYRKAAYKSYSKAQLRLAQCYLNGYGVNNNNRVALIWLRKAANSEDSEAEFLLARCYLKGVGVIADKKLAVKWFERAYVHGDPDAEAMLKILCVDVKGISLNKSGNHLETRCVIKFPDFNEQYILDLLNVSTTYYKGHNYYMEGRVTALSWNNDYTVFSSRVLGTYTYDCTLTFNRNRLVSHTCNCPAHYKYSGPCKHIVATMFAIINKKNDAIRKQRSKQSSVNNGNGIGVAKIKTPYEEQVFVHVKNVSKQKLLQDKNLNGNLTKSSSKNNVLDGDNKNANPNVALHNGQEKEKLSNLADKKKNNAKRGVDHYDKSRKTHIKAGKELKNNENQNRPNKESEINYGNVFGVIFILCIIFGVISLIAGWPEGACGAVVVLGVIFIIGCSM